MTGPKAPTQVPVRLRVSGVSHRPGYPTNLLSLSEQVEQRQEDDVRAARDWSDLNSAAVAGPEVLLVREPDNEHDPNAVQVHVPVLGRRQWVGFVPAERAEKLARWLDDGYAYKAFVTAVPIDPDYFDRPGLEIEIRLTGQQHFPECATRDTATAHLGCTCLDYTPEWTI